MAIDWLRRRLERIREWWDAPRRRLRAAARRDLARLFRERRDLLAATSLRPDHASRVQLLDVLESPRRICFGIVRHPRPYAFSRQFHEVLEVWCYHVEDERLERLKGVNLTRARGSDGETPSFGPGV